MQFPATPATLESLPNGLSLILDPDDSAPVISAQLWVETGSIHEGGQLGSGLSHFLEHMVFKGGGDFDSIALSETVQAAGGHWNAYTTFDRTVYYIDGPAGGLDRFLEVLAAMVFDPHLPESEFEREKDVIRREIDMGLDDPDDRFQRLLFETAWVRDARRQPVIGHRHLFDRVRHEELVDYHRRRYRPDRACLCLSGDFEESAVRARVERLFGALEASGGDEPLPPVDPPQLGPRHGHGRFVLPASKLCLAWKIPPLGHPDLPALDLAATLLGQGRASRLYRTLREDRGLALEISAWSWSQPGRDGLFAVSAEADPQRRDELLAAIRAELAAFPSSEFDGELAKAKRQLAAAQFRTLTTASGRAGDLASNWHEARDLDHTRRYLDRLEAVRPADLRRAFAHLAEEGETQVVLDPEEVARPAGIRPPRRARPAAESFTLANGTTVALLPDPRVPLFSLQAALRAGSPAETPATAGINRLLAASLPHGTRRHGAAELAGLLESLGASLGASSGNNSLLVQLSGLAPDLATLVPLFGELLEAPALPGDAIEREKASQLAALREALDDPLSLAFRQLRQQLFGDHGFGIPGLGDEASLASLDRLALAAHHSLHFRGPNLSVALAGDFDPAAARELLRAALDPLPGGDPWRPAASQFTEPGRIDTRLPKKQAVLALGFPGCAALDPQRHALRFLQEWSSDMGGPLFLRIREELGLAYRVGATQFHGHDTGLFSFYLATHPDQVELAERELFAEIDKLARAGIPDEAFERVRAIVLSATALEQQSPGAAARHAAIDGLFGLPVDHHRELPGIYQSLTPQAVQQAARQLLATRAASVVRVLPEAS